MDDLNPLPEQTHESPFPSEPTWRVAGASVRGTGHVKACLPCQDAHDVRVSLGPDGVPLLIAVASDGAGSARHAEDASRAACEFATARAEHLVWHDGLTLDRLSPAGLIADVRAHLEQLAASRDWAVRDLYCTFLMALILPDAALFMQVGDGAIVFGSCDMDMAFWPQGGEYANETHFVVSASNDQVHARFVPGPVTSVALLTDGLQMVALNMQQREPHRPFFDAFFQALQQMPERAAFEAALARTLEDDRINARTDDDKTLVVALLT